MAKRTGTIIHDVSITKETAEARGYVQCEGGCGWMEIEDAFFDVQDVPVCAKCWEELGEEVKKYEASLRIN